MLVRTMILAFALAPAMRGIAQQPQPAQQDFVQPAQSAPPEGSNWQHVQALPLGTSINVKARKSHLSCTLKSIDADTLTCIHGKDTVFQRTEIKSITIQRRGRSALIGAGIGGAALAIAGFAGTTDHSNGFFGNNFLRGPATIISGIVGGGIGAAVGATTDFSHSTVYQAKAQ